MEKIKPNAIVSSSLQSATASQVKRAMQRMCKIYSVLYK